MAKRRHINRSFFSDSLNIFIIRFLATLANLMIILYFSNTLSRSDYGRYSAFWVQLTVGITIASAGFALIAFTYKPEQLLALVRAAKKYWRILYAAFILVCGMVFSLLLQQNGVFRFEGIALLVPVLFFAFYCLSFQLETILIAFRQLNLLLLTNFIYPPLFFFIHFQAGKAAVFSMEELVLHLLILSLARFLFLFFCTMRVEKKIKAAPVEPLSGRAVKKLWLHLGIYDTLQIIFRQIDKLIISYIASKEALAIYYNGSQDIPFLPILLASVRSASLMQLSQANGDAATAVRIAHKASAILSLTAFASIAYLFFFREELIVTLFSEKYIASIPIFVCWLLVLPAQFCCPVFFILQNRQKGAVINKGAVLDMVLSLLLMGPFYYLWGAIGIAAALVAASYAQTIYYVWNAAQTLQVPVLSLLPLRNWTFKIVLFFGLNGVIYFSLRLLMPHTALLLCGGIITAFTALLVFIKESKGKEGEHNLLKKIL